MIFPLRLHLDPSATFRGASGWLRRFRGLLLAGGLAAAPAWAGEEIRVNGGEPLSYVMGLWGDAFEATHPDFSLKVQVTGEDMALQDLAAGRIQVAMVARDAMPGEIEGFKAKWGYPPTRVALAMDAVAFAVNKANPVKAMRIEAISSIFDENRCMGWPIDVLTWGDAGVRDSAWRDRKISRFRQPFNSSVMGLNAHFFISKDQINHKYGKVTPVFRTPTVEVPDAMALAEALAADPNGVASVTMAELFASEKAIAIITGDSGKAILPTPENVSSGAYPYSRFIYVYLNKAPGRSLDPALRDFLLFALSPEGQQMVKAAGQAPVPPDVRSLNRGKLLDSVQEEVSAPR